MAALLLACSDRQGPIPSLVDLWALLSYTDHGTAGVTTGTVEFRADASFEVLGTVTYPGEPTDSLKVSGTYAIQGGAVRLTVGAESSTWNLFWNGTAYLLTLRGGTPVTRMVLGPLG